MIFDWLTNIAIFKAEKLRYSLAKWNNYYSDLLSL